MIVVKIGGESIKFFDKYIAPDIKELSKSESIVIVHGGGNLVTEIAKRMGKEQRFVISPEGIKSRYTDEEDIKIFTMVTAGLINKELVSILNKNGVNAIGISGVDASFVVAERKKKLIVVDERGRKVAIDGGYTGRITNIKTEVIELLVENKFVPVVSPIAIGTEGELLNVDADTLAQKISSFLKPDYLVYLTDVEGVYLNGKVLSEIKVGEANSILPKIGTGMNRKVMAAVEAVKSGVKEAIISFSGKEKPVTSAILKNSGTVIKNE